MKSKHYPIHVAAGAESGNETAAIICAIRRLRPATALGALCLALVFALWSTSVQAACGQWDVSGSWSIKQSNGIIVHFELKQSSPAVSGTAWYQVIPGNGKNSYAVKGKVQGEVVGEVFKVTIFWEGNPAGVYSGMIGPNGVVKGVNYWLEKPSIKTRWSSVPMKMTCTERVSGPLPPAPPNYIGNGAYVILQSMPPAPFESRGFYVGGKYVVTNRHGDTVTLSNGSVLDFPVACVKLAPK